MKPLRFGLVGTGHWAQVTHAPALAAADGVELAAVWGRSPAATADLAYSHNVLPCDDLDTFLASVDAVAFAVPPDVQAPIAIQAARQGKHLLLEKPLALSEGDADALAEAVAAAGVASVVFFTARFQPEVRHWLAEVSAGTGWMGATAVWLGTALTASSPFNTPWRRRHGALWDNVPHVLALLLPALGPATSVLAEAGPADVTHLVLRHEGGATSTVTATLSAPAAAATAEVALWGGPGRSAAPLRAVQALPALRIALTELAANVASGQVSHPCDARFGQSVGRVLAQAQRQLPAGRFHGEH